ncbi:MAG: helix-turn-helix domain-containing protein [Defluviitaleaceae bacterium]|nr:helix-turn-helix domain-containing protein [Defluviitaleaceae bacterium]
MENSVGRSLEIIEARISQKLSVEWIAGSVHFSKYHYQRLFRELVGDSVMSYVTKRKLTLAGKMLLETERSVLEIALAFGFDSHEGFTRSFKAYMGVTPANYRKYHLSAISQKPVKGKVGMYSKTTNEIIKELNDFIVTAKELSNVARKTEGQFWSVIASKTDNLANRVSEVLTRITSIADNPDEITNSFAIIKILEDIAFNTNLMAFIVGLEVNREQDNPPQSQLQLAEKYYQLASIAHLKVGKITQFFSELSSLIFADIRKTASEKINELVQKGRAASDSIQGQNNIKYELDNLIRRIQDAPLNEAAVSAYEDFAFQLYIITFTLEVDNNQTTLDAVSAFKECLSDTVSFLQSITQPAPIHEYTPQQHLKDLTFQCNLLLFYTRGEIEKSGRNAPIFDELCERINSLISAAHSANKAAISQATEHLKSASVTIAGQGGAFKTLSAELKNLIDRIDHLLLQL